MRLSGETEIKMSRKQAEATHLERYFRKGDYMSWANRIYVIDGWDPDRFTLNVIEYETGSPCTLDYFEVFQDLRAGREPVFGKTITELFQKIPQIENRTDNSNTISEKGISQNLLRKAQHVIDVIEVVGRALENSIEIGRHENKKVNRTAVIKNCLLKLPDTVSLTTYYEYRARYEANNGVRARIAQSYTTVRYHKTQKSPALLHLIDSFLEHFYFRKKGPRFQPSTILRRIKRILKRTAGLWLDPKKCSHGIPADLVTELLQDDRSFDFISHNPEKMALLSRVESFSPSWFYERISYLEQLHDQPSDHTRTAFLRLGHRTQVPLDLQYMDEWQLTVFREYKGVREKIMDLWITWVLEGYARCITGFWVHAGTPNLEIGLTALKHSIFPKDLSQYLGYSIQMPFGIHKSLSLDNALMHDSNAYNDVAKMLSFGGQFPRMEFTFRPKGQPKYGGTIESGIGTFAEAFHDAMDEIVVFVEDLGTTNVNKQARQIVDYITRKAYQLVEEYHHTRHSALGQCPIECWNEAINETRGIPMIPRLTDEVDRMFWVPVYGDRILKDGQISLNGMHYVPLGISENSNELQTLNPFGKKNHFGIHSSPQNIGRIAVFNHGKWIDDLVARELLGPDGKTLRSVSKLERKIAQILAKKAGESASEWISFLGPTDDHRLQVEVTSAIPPQKIQNKAQSEDQEYFLSDQYWKNLGDSLSNITPDLED
jgi:hypothetical protein